MRRRSFYKVTNGKSETGAQENPEAKAQKTVLKSFEGLKEALAKIPQEQKGVCQKCGRHIGRGLHFHTKACKGDPPSA